MLDLGPAPYRVPWIRLPRWLPKRRYWCPDCYRWSLPSDELLLGKYGWYHIRGVWCGEAGNRPRSALHPQVGLRLEVVLVPLAKGRGKRAVSANIRRLKKEGTPTKQAVAISLRKAGKARKR